MRVGIEAFTIYRKHKHGIDISSLELIKQLQKNDKVNQYFIFCFDEQENNLLYESENLKIINVPKITSPLAEQLILPLLVLKYKIDVLHSTGNTAPLIKFCKQIITVHDIIYLEKNPFVGGSIYQKLGNLYRRLIVPIVIKRADQIITVSQSEQRNIEKKFSKLKNPIGIVKNSYSSHFFVKPENSIQSTLIRYRLATKPYILFLGNQDPKKNVENVLKAFAALIKSGAVDHQLVITDLALRVIKRKLDKLNIGFVLPYITVTNYVTNTDLPDLYNGATCFIYPSKRESFGIPILEAMACGCPLITSNCSSMPEIADKAAMLVDPNEEKEIAQALIKYIQEPALRQSKTEQGLSRVLQFSWEESSLKLMKLYERILHPEKKTKSLRFEIAIEKL